MASIGLLKHKVSKCARNFGSHLTKLKRCEEENVISKIITLYGKTQDGLSEAELVEFIDLQTQLDSTYKAEGSFIRSRRI